MICLTWTAMMTTHPIIPVNLGPLDAQTGILVEVTDAQTASEWRNTYLFMGLRTYSSLSYVVVLKKRVLVHLFMFETSWNYDFIHFNMAFSLQMGPLAGYPVSCSL